MYKKYNIVKNGKVIEKNLPWDQTKKRFKDLIKTADFVFLSTGNYDKVYNIINIVEEEKKYKECIILLPALGNWHDIKIVIEEVV